MWEKAKAARKYLRSDAESSYREFDDEHKHWLAEHEDPTERQRRRRLQFIERVGLECALWPVMFWKTSMCLTHVRATDSRRLGRENFHTLEQVLDAEVDMEEEDDNGETGARHSIK
eukprot:4260032-Amphidinium_carterae.1